MTPKEIEALRRIVAQEHDGLAVELYGPEALTDERLTELVAAGVLSAEAIRTLGLLGSTYEKRAERVRVEAAEGGGEVASGGGSAGASGGGRSGGGSSSGGGASGGAAGRGGSAAPVLSDWERRYAENARTRGAQLIVGLGQRASNAVVDQALSADELAERRKAAVAEGIAQAIETRGGEAEAREQVIQALEEDFTRDLDRIVKTELLGAVNQGFADAIKAVHGPEALVQVAISPDACPACQRLYLDEDGEPRIFKLAELPPWGANRGRKAEAWVPTVPPLHPNCACQLVYLPGIKAPEPLAKSTVDRNRRVSLPRADGSPHHAV